VRSTAACRPRSQAAGGRHRRPAPQRAALSLAAEHHEGEEEAEIDVKKPGDYGVDVAPRLKVLKVTEPPSARPASRSRPRPIWSSKLKTEAGVALMAVLVVADTTTRTCATPPRRRVTAALQAMGGDVDVLVAGCQALAPWPPPPPSSPACARCILAEAPHLANGVAEEVISATIVA
jgi:hypothetical protein